MAGAASHAYGTRGPSPTLVGREVERVLLNEQLAAVAAGRGNVVIIGGEAGIGKTSLARDLAARAVAQGFMVLTGQCHDLTATPPYGLWIDLAEHYAHVPGDPGLPAVPSLLDRHALDRIGSQSALFDDVTTCLRDMAAVRPAVIVLEDVHWADPASLELLRYVSTRIAHVPVLLLITYREDELTRQNPFYRQLPSLVRESEGLRLDLHRLGPAELGKLVQVTYDLPEADQRRLVAYLQAHTDGNPFFVLELLRALEGLAGGGLVDAGGAWTLGDIDRVVVPPLVRQIIDSRVDRLGEAPRALLTIAAVIGHEPPLDLVATIAGTSPEAVYDAVDRAIEHHLLAATTDGAGVQFVHALTREALYASMPPHRRRTLHREVAEALERQPRPDADAIGYHYQHAGDQRAPAWLMRAGDRAQRAYAWLTARHRFETAASLLEAVPGEERTRARLLYRCGRLLRYADAEAAIELLGEASRLAGIAGDDALTADATYSRGLVQCFADQWRTGVAGMARGIALLEALPPRQAWVPAQTSTWMADALADRDDLPDESLTAIGPARHRSLTWFLAASGRLAEARELADRFDDGLPDTGMPPLALANLGHLEFGRGIALAALGQPDAASAAFARARERYLRLDHHAVLAFVDLTELLDVQIPYRARDRDGRQRLATAAFDAINRSRGAIPADVQPGLAHLPGMVLDGRWDEALRLAAECRVHGTYVLRRPVTLAVATIALARGDGDAVRAQVRRVLPRGPETEPGDALLADALPLQRIAAAQAIEDGDVTLARRWLEANDRWLAWSGAVLGRADNRLAWARLHHAEGDAATAQALAELARAAATPDQPLVLIGAERLLGTIALASDNRAAAAGSLGAALDLAGACELPWERALTLVELAALPDADALTLLGEARAICDHLGAVPMRDHIDAMLARDHRAASPAPAGLTSREVEVLRLVAGGLTDAEVANRLSISPRTVGQHLRSVYGKLEVRSRTEATRFAIEHGVA